ncbi:5-formyltetrahydrofolate cyclo-ligase [Rhodovulum sulfidophilum]|uniref:5-formyltetrahydrofolate cyclo-ligase n=1 Tax=Rhodovulum sulfidophilum TaxID=35806 RepID=A0A0D6B5D7_RHOSU|nr:5-formyltetrahydrofolate cyclo-ligase [Rhodovulum sulfidophilum]
MIAEAKALLRTEAQARRAEAHDPERGAAALSRLGTVLAPHRGRPAAGYLPIRTELDPRPAMAGLAASGPVGVPVIEGRGQPLGFRLWVPDCALETGPFGVAVPAGARPMVPEVLIVPLLAFDRRGIRLGYGGGFYDRTLELLRAQGPVLAVGLAYAAQEMPDLPAEPTDLPLDAIVTETEVILP